MKVHILCGNACRAYELGGEDCAVRIVSCVVVAVLVVLLLLYLLVYYRNIVY